MHLDHASPRYGGMYCRDQESLNWLAQCTWLMAADQYLIVLAISCIGSFRGEARIESQASSPCGLPCGVPWTEHPDRSSPSAPVLRRACRRTSVVCHRWPSRGSISCLKVRPHEQTFEQTVHCRSLSSTHILEYSITTQAWSSSELPPAKDGSDILQVGRG